MKGKRTISAMFAVSQMQDKLRVKGEGKKVYFGFVDLEKHVINTKKSYLQ